MRYGDSWIESLPSAARFLFDVSVVTHGMPNNGDTSTKSSGSPSALADRIHKKQSNWKEDMR